MGRVEFPRAFSARPTVTLSTVYLDTWNSANTRIRLEVTDVTREGFEFSTRTWADSRVYGVGGSWLAIAAPRQ